MDRTFDRFDRCRFDFFHYLFNAVFAYAQTEKEYALNENGLISDGEGHTSNSIYSGLLTMSMEMYRQYYIGGVG